MLLLPLAMRRWLARLRQWFADTTERGGDSVKDFLLDWSAPEPRQPPARELPLLSPEAFVEAMRGRVEETLREMAAAINRAPTGDVVRASEEEVRGLFGELWWDALERGAQMRLDAGLAELPPPPGGQTGWAARYRRMRTEDGFPPFTEDDEPTRSDAIRAGVG